MMHYIAMKVLCSRHEILIQHSCIRNIVKNGLFTSVKHRINSIGLNWSYFCSLALTTFPSNRLLYLIFTPTLIWLNSWYVHNNEVESTSKIKFRIHWINLLSWFFTFNGKISIHVLSTVMVLHKTQLLEFSNVTWTKIHLVHMVLIVPSNGHLIILFCDMLIFLLPWELSILLNEINYFAISHAHVSDILNS